MSGSTIGIKIADGSFYPVLEEGYTGRKRLTLTTVKDNQDKVQIDLYRGDGDAIENAQYIGSLLIENINPAPKGQPDIELLLGLDTGGELTAEASDRSTGESQSFSISLKTLSAEETYEIPEFEMEGDTTKSVEPEELPLTGETYPVGEKDRRKDHLERRGPNVALLVLFIVLGLALIVAIGWFVYRSVTGAAGSAPAATDTEAMTPAEPAPTTAAQEPAAAQPESTATAQQAPAAAAQQAEPAPTAEQKPAEVAQSQSQAGGVSETAKPAASAQPQGGVTYRIKKGDTLWDISSTYYRNPWLYPKLAKANKIKNPDLIFADTTIFIPEE